jgi:acetyl-CoA carboxylase, biotin carboxylase subunit
LTQRVDTWARPGNRISSAYDSLLAKVITWGRDRDEALSRMRRALWEFRVSGAGVRTTREFLADVLDHPVFLAAGHDTGIVDLVSADRLAPGTSGVPGRTKPD